MRLLVGYDGSEFARRALQRAASIAGKKGHVFVASVLPDNAQASDMVTRKRLLEEAAALLGEKGVPHTTVEASGKAATAITQAADEHSVDIIVVGSRGRGAAASMLLGSVSSTLVRESARDVLVVR